jgi:2'-5' RNA ligase
VRVFAALEPPAEVRGHADAALAPVRERWPDLRWVPPERWHLTLAFYGEVPDEKAGGTAEILARRLAGHTAVELRLRGAGQFGRRALWLGLAGDVPALRRIARAVAFERRPYRPHLTVARLRGSVDAGPAAEALSAYEGPPFVATSVRLVRSRLGPSPTYENIAAVALDPRP